MTPLILALLLSQARVAAPTLAPAAGTYASTQSVTVSSRTPGATILCTTDGTDPRRSSGRRYTAAISVSTSSTVQCFARRAGYRPSTVTSAAYTINTTPTGLVAMGTNLNWMTYWDPEKLSADLMWTALPFTYVAGGGANGYNTAYWTPIDASGWPIVTPGTAFGAVFDGSPWPGTYKLSFTNRQGTTGDTISAGASQQSNVTFANRSHNAGTNVTTYDVVVSSYVAGSNIAIVWAGSTGGVTDVHLMRPLKSGTGWHAVGTPLADYIVDRLAHFTTIRPMQTQSGESGKSSGLDSAWSDRTSPWGPQTRSRTIAGRFGGAAIENLVAMANQVQKDLWINVPYNATDDYITKMAQVIKCGSDGTNPWVSTGSTCAGGTPVFAPLGPGLKLYVEHGNELWNSSAGYWEGENESAANDAVTNHGDPYYLDAVVVTTPSEAFRQEANDSGVPGWGWRRMGYVAARASLIFRSVFGDAAMMTRIRPIAGTQHGRYSVTYHMLRYLGAVWGPWSPYATVANADFTGTYANPRQPLSYYVWGYAGAPYVPTTSGGFDTTTTANILTGMYRNLTEANYPTSYEGNIAPDIGWNSNRAGIYGIKYLAYEGGEGLYPGRMSSYAGDPTGSMNRAIQASFDPTLGALMGANISGGVPAADQTGYVYGTMLKTWAAGANTDLFVHFTMGEVANSDSLFGLCAPTSRSDLLTIPGWSTAMGTTSSDCRFEYGPKWDAIKAFSTLH